MAKKRIEGIDETVQLTNIWLKEIQEQLHSDDRQRAYLALRGFLHALRDYLTPEESSDFAAQLPMLVRGIYYEGWNPAKTPVRERDAAAFLDRVADEAVLEDRATITHAVKAVSSVVKQRITPGEYEDVLGVLPGDIRQLLAA